MTDIVESHLPDEQTILAYTHGKREELVSELMKDGPPKDNDSQKVLLSLLKDMDSSALSRMKIKVDLRNTADAEKRSELITEILKRTNANMFMAATCVRDTPSLPDSVPVPVTIDGELSTVIEHESFDDFMLKFPKEE